MSVETAFRLTGSALEIKGATENLSALPEFSGGEVTETELPVRKMVRPADQVTVFSVYSPVETITELPQAENIKAKPMSWLEGITRHKKEAAAGLSVLAVQTACTWSEVAKVVDDVATFLPPSAGCILFGGALLSGWLFMIYKFAKYQDYSSQSQKKIPLKIDKGERKDKGISWKVQKGLEKETKMKIRLKG